jgi:8-oxo-dGTP diphosphatase
MKYSIAGISYKNGKVLIGKRIEKGDMGGRWEFPGGKVEKGENFTQALIREFDEEFGVPITVGKEITVAKFNHHGDERELHAFFVTMPDIDNFKLCEHTETKRVKFSEITKLDFVDSDMLIFEQVRDVCEK